jgi:hypothetical protein
MRQALVLTVIMLVLAGGGATAVRAQNATPQPVSAYALGYPELKISVANGIFTLPETVASGRYLVTVDNMGSTGVDANLVRLPNGVTTDQAIADIATPTAGLPDWLPNAIFAGGPIVLARQTGQTIADLAPGNWLVFSDGAAPQPFTVSASTATPATPLPDPSATLTVGLQEYSFVGLSGTLQAGPQIWKVTNAGTQPHFLELIKVPDGTTIDQVMGVLMMGEGATPAPGMLDPSLIEGVGGIGDLSPGQTGWYVTDLPPATYAALCFFPDAETGAPHALLGMIQVFTVA